MEITPEWVAVATLGGFALWRAELPKAGTSFNDLVAVVIGVAIWTVFFLQPQVGSRKVKQATCSEVTQDSKQFSQSLVPFPPAPGRDPAWRGHVRSDQAHQ